MRSNSKSASQGGIVADRGDLERLLRLASALQKVAGGQDVAPKRATGKRTGVAGAIGRAKFRPR